MTWFDVGLIVVIGGIGLWEVVRGILEERRERRE